MFVLRQYVEIAALSRATFEGSLMNTLYQIMKPRGANGRAQAAPLSQES